MANEVSRWQIATACDVELGKHFQPGQMFEGKVLCIDEEAIRTTIQQMDPVIATEQQELLFQATDMLSDRHSNANGISAGLFQRHKETGAMGIHVAVNRISRLASFSHIFMRKAPGSQHPAKPEAIQHTAIHELRHAIDFADEDTRSKLKKEDEPTRGNLIYVVGSMAVRKFTYMALGASAGLYSSNFLTGSRPVEIASGIVGAIVGSFAARSGREKALQERVEGAKLYKYIKQSSAEKNARESAEQADLHPQIISID